MLDMMQVDMIEVIENRLEEIEKGLFKTLVDQSLVKNDRYGLSKLSGDKFRFNSF